MATISRTLIIKATDPDGDDIQKTLTHANPNATDENIDTFARAFNGLSRNNYVDTIVQDTHSVREALIE